MVLSTRELLRLKLGDYLGLVSDFSKYPKWTSARFRPRSHVTQSEAFTIDILSSVAVPLRLFPLNRLKKGTTVAALRGGFRPRTPLIFRIALSRSPLFFRRPTSPSRLMGREVYPTRSGSSKKSSQRASSPSSPTETSSSTVPLPLRSVFQ